MTKKFYIVSRFVFILFLFSGISQASHAQSDHLNLLYDNLGGEIKFKPDLKSQNDILLRQAFALENIADNEGAENYYQKYFQSGSQSAFARYSFSRLLLQQKKDEQALVQIGLAIKQNPENSRYAIFKIDLLRKLQKKDEALEFCRSVYRNYAKSIAGIEFHYAELLFEQKKYSQALFHYRQVLMGAQDANSQTNVYKNIALWRVSHILIDAGQNKTARKYLEQYVQQNPHSYYAKFVLIEYIYLYDGEVSRAHSLFQEMGDLDEKGLQANRISIDAFYHLKSIACYVNSDVCFLGALTNIENQRALNPLEQAMLHEWFKLDRQAISILLKLIKKNPQSLYARVVLLNVLERSQRQDLYLKSLFESVAIAYQNNKLPFLHLYLEKIRNILDHETEFLAFRSEYYRNESYYYNLLNQYHRAARSLSLAIENYPQADMQANHANLLQLKLRRAFYKGQSSHDPVFFEGLHEAQKIADCNECPNQVDAQSITGILLMDLHDWTGANKYLQASYEKNKNSRNLYWSAVCEFESGNQKSAISKMEEITNLEQSPVKQHAKNFLAWKIANSNGDLDKALSLSADSLVDNPLDYNRHDTSGYIFYKRNEFNKSLYHLHTALALLDESNKTNPVVLAHLGDVYQKTGKKKTAQLWYTRAKNQLQQKLSSLTKRPANQEEKKLLERLNQMDL